MVLLGLPTCCTTKQTLPSFALSTVVYRLGKILPWLRGQPSLKSLSFSGSSINSNGLLLFHDPESTHAFVDNVLLPSPLTNLKELYLRSCGVSLENRPLMDGFHKNTTVVDLYNVEDAAQSRFMDPILQRNVYLGHVHDMLGRRKTMTTTTTTTSPAAAATNVVGEPMVDVPTIIVPPLCSLWPIVLAKVGQGTQGASPVFTILSDRLATWMVVAP